MSHSGSMEALEHPKPGKCNEKGINYMSTTNQYVYNWRNASTTAFRGTGDTMQDHTRNKNLEVSEHNTKKEHGEANHAEKHRYTQ